ncbi:hypothetical protein CHS0354_010857 [Potamilus streckersoni]|uniref:Nuclear pore complex protein Nup155 n=1 Tax=Potamilus streckersoni TaxID=2493646 RepID=A0AAE0SNM0_9BIVA|nr:hypothetical protein CHS0354_010857 [Potamilus streckersoni]
MATFIIPSGTQPPHTTERLEDTCRLVEKFLQEDRNQLDLSELLRVPAINQPSVSGLQDFHYPSLLETGLALESLSEIGKIKRVPLPAELIEQFGRMQLNCQMGLFPEIERAWLSVDSDIFLWKYEDGGDLAYFDGLNETILCAALVKPRPGIFQPYIKFLLCLATPIDIVLLGASFTGQINGNEYEEMHLLPDPLFSIPTDNTYITSIVGTGSGRIFMTGKDGCLYELAYQAEDGWFGRKCRKINHSTSSLSFLVPSFLNFSFSEDDSLVQITVDESRNILYTRSDKGTIQVYDLGADGKGMSKAAAISVHNIVHAASNIARTIDRSHFKSIVQISALTNKESANIHLVAVTQTGTLLLVASQGENSNLLWTISNDSFPFQTHLMESQTTVPLDGKTWALCEVEPKQAKIPKHGTPGDQFQFVPLDPPVVVSQHAEAPRKLVLLNAQGSYILHKMRPVDQLRQLLIDFQGPDSEEVKAFFRLHKIEQACATCLILACTSLAADQQVADWARMAFFQYGGEAQYNVGGGGGGGAVRDRHLMPSTIGPSGAGIYSSPNSSSLLHTPGMTPFPSQPSAVVTPGIQHYPQTSTSMPALGQPGYTHMTPYMPDVTLSGKHNGICLYMARILRPIWDVMVTKDFPCQTPQGIVNYLTCNYHPEELEFILERMHELSDFVDFNSRFDSGPAETSIMSTSMPFTPHLVGAVDDQTRRKLQAEAQKIEKISLLHVQKLLHYIEEVLGLLQVLLDHQFHTLTTSLTQDQQNQLRSMTFKTLVINGRELFGVLINCLISRYLDDNATIDTISSKLREVCPTLYSTDDATCSKANELLQSAKINQNQIERREQLREALKLYKSVSKPLNLPEVCNQFASVHFYEGIVDLCLAMANKVDPHQLALLFHKNDEQPDDMQGVQELMNRKECYKCITETLCHLMSASISHPQSPSIPQSPGPPPAPDPSRLSAADAEHYKNQVFKLALKSDDELFHVSLYEWLFGLNATDMLLEIQSPFLEPYLKRRAGYQVGDTATLDLLWKYYEKNQNFGAAARILSRLAERHSTDVDLQERMEYLSRAIMCAKSSTSHMSSAAEGEFLHELEDKMEVARLQMQVQRTLSKESVHRHDIQEILSRLDFDLMDISMLYEDFAVRFDLSECQLAIVHCAGVYDSALVENLWQNIIDKEMTATKGNAGQNRVTSISNKLAAVGKLYVKTEKYFPVAFLIRYLEQKSCQDKLDTKWVYLLMLDIGVPALKIMEIYDRMLKSRDPYWQSVHQPLHLLNVIHCLLCHLHEYPAIIPPYERRHFYTLTLDYIAAYLVELQAISSTDQHVRKLMQKFRSLQMQMDPM